MLNDAAFARDGDERQRLLLAKDEIRDLRRWYAIGTDLLGRPDGFARGLAVYRRIFAADARISVRGGARALSGEGPEAWAEVARNALKDYAATQHLIGSQVVTFSGVTFNGKPPEITGGHAEMLSYVQAWHAWPDRRLRLVLGTYEDTVRFEADVGWQIAEMVLVYTDEEYRPLGDAR